MTRRKHDDWVEPRPDLAALAARLSTLAPTEPVLADHPVFRAVMRAARFGGLGDAPVALVQQALEVARRVAPESEWPAWFRAELARHYSAVERPGDAERILLESLAEARQGDATGRARTLASLVQLRLRFGGDAAEPLERLRALCAADADVQYTHEASVGTWTATLAQRSGDGVAEERALLARVDAVRRKEGPGSEEYVFALVRVGEHQTRQGRLDAADRTLVVAREAATRVAYRAHAARAQVLAALTELAVARGSRRDASAHLAKLELAWKAGDRAQQVRLGALRITVGRMADLAPGPTPPPVATPPPVPTPEPRAASRMRHPKLGVGEVLSRDGEKVRLRMDDGEERTFLAARLVPIDD